MSRGLKLLARAVGKPAEVDIWSWATVTSTSPSLRIRLDGESTALDISLDPTRDSLVASLAVNDRVRVQLVPNPNPARRHRRLVITGKAGG